MRLHALSWAELTGRYIVLNALECGGGRYGHRSQAGLWIGSDPWPRIRWSLRTDAPPAARLRAVYRQRRHGRARHAGIARPLDLPHDLCGSDFMNLRGVVACRTESSAEWTAVASPGNRARIRNGGDRSGSADFHESRQDRHPNCLGVVEIVQGDNANTGGWRVRNASQSIRARPGGCLHGVVPHTGQRGHPIANRLVVIVAQPREMSKDPSDPSELRFVSTARA